MLCPNCESENRDGAKFCDECGFPLTGAIAKAAAGQMLESEHPTEAMPAMGEAEAGEPAQGPGSACAETAGPDEAAAEAADETDEAAAEGTGAPVPEQPTEHLADAVRAHREDDGEDLDTFNRDATEVIKPDLLGFDTLSDEYGAAQPRWGEGDTMQMEKVEGAEKQKAKDFRASSTVRKSRKGKGIAAAIAAVVLVAAVAAFGSYQAGVWGGKTVPDVAGMTEADARSVLGDEGFEPRVEQVKSDDTEGVVLIVDPAAGSRLEEGSEVVIHVAAARTVPDVSGKTEAEATEVLAAEGYENVSVKKKSSEKKKGTVIGIDPKAGERALSTAEITITIAQPYTVPDVSGKSLDDAVKAVEKAGLGYEAVYISTDSYAEGTVIATEPASGAEVKKGSYVVIQVAQARGAELEQIAREQLAAGMTIDKNGRSYVIDSLDSVAFLGNDTVSYTATAREFVYVFGSTVSNPNAESISGTIVFNENNEVVAVS